jgi:4-amino-4-deoxy-L-arabinose transferase-like glycosyltransferase
MTTRHEADIPSPTVSGTEKSATKWTARQRLALVFVLLVGGGAWLAYVGRPLDYRIRSPWRQADYAQIARNFYREGMNIAYPRIDWRGAGPGYVEAEFPLIPWLGALLFKIFGYREQMLRVSPVFFAIASLLLLAAFARRLLPPTAAIFATGAFAANPLLFHLATAIQPEPLMLFFSLVAVASCWRWGEHPDRPLLLLGTAAAIAAATLAKAPALYLGVVVAYEVLRRLSIRAFATPVVYLAVAIVVVPPLAWYVWARHFWIEYGNSLGVSNGDHFLTWAMLTSPRFLVGIVKWETLGVFTPFGWLLGFAALCAPWERVERPLVWYGATWLFYIAAAKTTAADWAYYYHAIAVAPACLLMGTGLAAIMEGRVVATGWIPFLRSRKQAAGLLAGMTLLTLLALVGAYVHLRDGRAELLPMYDCSREFARFVAPDRLIVVAGAPRDEDGSTGANNISMPFSWMDRKGFNYPADDLGVEMLDRIAAKGGQYWMANKKELETLRESAGDLKYTLVASCKDVYFLYDLTPGLALRSHRGAGKTV